MRVVQTRTPPTSRALRRCTSLASREAWSRADLGVVGVVSDTDARQPIAPAIFYAARLISIHSPLMITSTPIAGKPQVNILSQPGWAMSPVDAGFAGS